MPSNIDCPYHREGLCVDVVRVEEQTKNLINWQKSQNGRLGKIDEKLDRLNVWIMGLLGTALVAVILLAVNMAIKLV